MSRATYSNERYTLAFGVDHTPMGTFIQVWDKSLPEDDNDGPTFEYDALFGPRLRLSDHFINTKVKVLVEQIVRGWPEAKRTGCKNLGEEDVIAFAWALGLWSKGLEQRVYELWD